MYSQELLEHFQNPRNVGDLQGDAVRIEVSNPACGDILQLAVRIEENRVAAAAYRVRGCTASIAAGSALTELLLGRALAELPRVGRQQVEQALGGLTPETRHAAVLAADAVKAVLRSVKSSLS